MFHKDGAVMAPSKPHVEELIREAQVRLRRPYWRIA